MAGLEPIAYRSRHRPRGGGDGDASEEEGAGQGGARREQVQEIRIVNNPFNVENANASSRGPVSGIERTEVIQRGGIGALLVTSAAVPVDGLPPERDGRLVVLELLDFPAAAKAIE